MSTASLTAFTAVDADLRRVAGHRVEHADDDFLGLSQRRAHESGRDGDDGE